jgi:hypothetical protein
MPSPVQASASSALGPELQGENIMQKIIFTALGSALIALSAANAASAAERHHARRVAPQQAYDARTDFRNSRAEFGPLYQSSPNYDARNWGGGDARAWGGAISAPAGH